MRRAVLPSLLLFALLLASPGCLSSLLCPGCRDQWVLAADDAGAYEAMGEANLSRPGVSFDQSTPRRGLPLDHPRLDEAWGEHALVQATWRPEPEPPLREVAMYVSGSRDRAQLYLWAEAEASEARLRAWLDEFLANVSTLDEDARAAWADAVLANRTASGERTTAEPQPDGTLAPRTEVSAWSYGANVTLPWRLDALFREATAGTGVEPREAETRNVGDVEAGDWTFTFWFPLRVLRVEADAAAANVQANAHGGVYGYVRLAERGDEEDARETLRRLLGHAGLEGLDVRAWTLR